MYAKIVKDMIDCTDVLGSEYQRQDTVIISDGKPYTEDEIVLVRMLDDDRNPYYDLIATSDTETLETVFEWCMADAGTTILQLKNEQGEWHDVMN